MSETLMTPSAKQEVQQWMALLRDRICARFEALEAQYQEEKGIHGTTEFTRKTWERHGGGGGETALMRGMLFEKVGVNVSTVHGTFEEVFRAQIPGAEATGEFWACGISLVAHMSPPHVPIVHMNTRCIQTTKQWWGGGMDLTPTFPFSEDTALFHGALKQCCDAFDLNYYPRFKDECDRYFYLPHRQEPRGVGGIFYDYHHSGNWQQDFDFTKAVGNCFLETYPTIVEQRMCLPWTEEDKQAQLKKRGRYVEFNLLHDRGTKFGLMTGGNIEAILMSLPPEARW
jgi:coproporphyrinogen III oxidase